MNKIETVVAEEFVAETVEPSALELTLLELDMVGGGSYVVGLA